MEYDGKVPATEFASQIPSILGIALQFRKIALFLAF